MTLLQAMMVAALLVSGMGVALLGSVKLPLASRLRIDEAQVGGLVSLFGFVMIPVIFAAGFLTDLTDQLGPRVVFLSGCLLMALSLGVLALARSYGLALSAVVLLSGGWSLLINAGNVLTPPAFHADIHGMPYATNLANVFFGLGAFLTPLAAAFLVRRTSLPAALALLGGLALVPAALAPGVDFAALVSPAGTALGPSLGALLADPVLWLCGLALFCYGPLEASMGAWSTTYLGERGVRAGIAAGLLSGFWLAFMLSRLATAFWLPAGRGPLLILVLALLCVGMLLGVVFSSQATTAMALVLAAGFLFGPIFPTLLAVLLGHFPQAVHGRVVGLLFAIGGIGWTTLPLLIGAYARRTSVQRGFSIAVAPAVGLCVIALILTLR